MPTKRPVPKSSKKASKPPSSFINNPKYRGLLLLGLLWSLITVALVTALIVFIFKYTNEHKQVERLSDPSSAVASQTQALINQVGKLVQLPLNEAPTIATVTDITKLKGQAFFAEAQNGDKVLIYTRAKEAILYRPSTNKVIQIAPVNLGGSSSQGTAQPGQ